MSYLKSTKNNTSYRFSLGSASDTTNGLFPAVKTHNTGNGGFAGLLTNVMLYAGRTYYVKVKYRTRGDGTSTSSKCSAVGFITYWNNWNTAIGYIHSSATAYSEIGKIVEWTYSFTVSEDVQPQGTALYFIINNGWANGNDGQTIDLFYYKYWDSLGNVYNENGNPSASIVSKWSGNSTSILTEKSLTNTTTSENYLWSEIIDKKYMAEGETYTIDFDAKISGDVKSVEVCFYSSDYSSTGFITSKNIGIPQTYYTHYSHTFTFARKNSSSVLPSLRIRFDNNGIATAGNTGTLYVKNVTLRVGKNDAPTFLKSTKNGNIFYSKMFSSGRLRANASYLRQGLCEYKYSEISDTYAGLTSYYCY